MVDRNKQDVNDAADEATGSHSGFQKISDFIRHLSLAQKITAGFTIPVILMIIVAFAVLDSIDNLLDTAARVQHTQEVIGKGHELEKLIVNMETGERGFLLTGKESFLEPFVAAQARWDKEIDSLKLKVNDNSTQVLRLDKIDRAQKLWHEKAAIPEIATRKLVTLKKKSFADVQQLIENETGKVIIDRLRVSLGEFISIEEELMEARFLNASDASSHALNIIVAGSLAAILFAILASLMLARYVGGKSKELLQATHRVATGDFDPIIFVDSGDEFGRLGTSFNQMILDLKNSRDELKRSTDVAEQANKSKSIFLANMSHEIRTPMTGVIGMADLVLNSDLSPQQLDWVTSIQKSGKHLLGILNEILDQSKLEAGKIVISPTDFHLVSFVDDVTQALMPSITSKGLELEVNLDENLPVGIYADSLRISQVLTNLLSNALKFTAAGRITIDVSQKTAEDDNIGLHISVTDSGVGMTHDQQRHIFSPFQQADSSTSRKYGGTGLGLTISKQLAELMKGKIGVESTEGVGSRFWFEIPCSPAKSVVNPVDRGKSLDLWITSRPLTILVADDTLVMRQLIQGIFESLNHEITIVNDGQEAVESAKSQDFDLILMDVRMPVLDGLEATKLIRKIEGERSKVPIIALTADIAAGNITEYTDIGMDGVCAKPIELPILLKMINRLLKEDIHSTYPHAPDPRNGLDSKPITEVLDDDEQSESFVDVLQRVSNIVDQLTDDKREEFSETLNMPGFEGENLVKMVDSYEKGLVDSCSKLRDDFDVFSNNQKNDECKNNLAMRIHSLKGGGTTYGYRLITIIATAADDLIKEKSSLREDDVQNVGNHIDGLLLVSNKKLTGNGGKAGRILLQGLKNFASSD